VPAPSHKRRQLNRLISVSNLECCSCVRAAAAARVPLVVGRESVVLSLMPRLNPPKAAAGAHISRRPIRGAHARRSAMGEQARVAARPLFVVVLRTAFV
jgi:hypothetical protein